MGVPNSERPLEVQFGTAGKELVQSPGTQSKSTPQHKDSISTSTHQVDHTFIRFKRTTADL